MNTHLRINNLLDNQLVEIYFSTFWLNGLALSVLWFTFDTEAELFVSSFYNKSYGSVRKKEFNNGLPSAYQTYN